MDLRRSTVDLDFTCFNSMSGRNRPPTIAKFQKSKSILHLFEISGARQIQPFIPCYAPLHPVAL